MIILETIDDCFDEKLIFLRKLCRNIMTKLSKVSVIIDSNIAFIEDSLNNYKIANKDFISYLLSSIMSIISFHMYPENKHLVSKKRAPQDYMKYEVEISEDILK